MKYIFRNLLVLQLNVHDLNKRNQALRIGLNVNIINFVTHFKMIFDSLDWLLNKALVWRLFCNTLYRNKIFYGVLVYKFRKIVDGTDSRNNLDLYLNSFYLTDT